MKYLDKSFTVAMGSTNGPTEAELAARREKASKPHEFEGASICLLCGMDSKAKIHEPHLV